MGLDTSKELKGNLGDGSKLSADCSSGQGLNGSLSAGSCLQGIISAGTQLTGELIDRIPRVRPFIAAVGFASVAGFGTLAAANVPAQPLTATGFTGTSAFGSPTIADFQLAITASGLTGTAGFGSPTVADVQLAITASGLTGTAGFGSPTVGDVQLSLAATGLASSAAIGSLVITNVSVSRPLVPSGLAGAGAIGAPTVADVALTIIPGGLSGTAALGSPTVENVAAQTLSPTAFTGTAALGGPTVADVVLAITATGFTGTAAQGSPTVANVAAQTLAPTGLSDSAAIGSPTVADVTLAITATGLAGTPGLGGPTVANVAAQTLSPTGLADASAIGSPTVADVQLSITATGHTGTAGFGSPTLANLVQTLSPTAFTGTAGFGGPTVSNLVQTLSPTAFTGTAGLGGPTIASLDADLAAYLARVSANSGTLSAAEETAMANLIKGLKDGGYWSGCTHLFCFIGSDHNSAKTYVKGGQDGTSGGSVNIFNGTHYARETGFYREGSSVYNCEFNLGSNSTFNWGGSDPITTYYWGRNSRNGARQGLHPATQSADQWSLPSYHEGAYGGGWQIKARKANGATQENGWGGSSLDTASFVGMAYDGSTGFACRSMNQSDTKSGTSLTLSSTIRSVNSAFEITVDNPVLGVALWDGVEHTNTEMDAINELFHDFATDCGITMGAYDPDTD